jgi:hypothetical protein
MGGVFALLADTKQAELQSAPHPKAEVEELISAGKSNQTTANVLFGVGLVAMAAGGLIVWMTDEPKEKPASIFGKRADKPSNDISVNIGPTGASLTVSF